MPKRTARKVAPAAEPAALLQPPPEQHVVEQETMSSSKSAFGDRVSAGFAELYGSELLCDFKVSCGGEELPVHSVVLYSQSRYFRGLFKSNMREAIERLLHLDEPAPVVKSLLEYFYTGDYSLPHALQQPMAHHASLIIAARKFDVGGLDALALRRFLDEGEAFSSNADSASDSGDPAATDFFTAAKIIYYSAGDGAGGEDNDVLTAQVLAIASRKMQSLSAESQTRWVAHLIEVPPLAVAFTMKQHSLLQAYEGKPIVAAVAAGKASPQKGGKASTKAVKAAEREREEEVVVVAAPAPVAVPASPRKRKGAKLQQQDVMMMEEFGMPMPELEPALVGERERELEELFEG